jgi:type IV pilus assembly protein PilZ
MQADGESGDRREGGRAPIELKVEYKKLNTFFADYTRNICKGGTFIKTRKPLDEGTEFVFKLVVPKLAAPLAIRGEVKWVVKPDPDATPTPDGPAEGGMGIRFIYASDEERRAIEAVVERLMIDSLGQLIYSKLMDPDRATRSGRSEAEPPDRGRGR